ncbi:MAG: von Willebrand factor type [Verrucomicrobiales bacterium]|nr:von Willebrand factor type [Verrucomicrobiales bacterium]
MTFAHPYFLLLLLLLPLFAWLKGKYGAESAFLYSSVQLVKPISGLSRSRAGRVLMALRWLSLALFIIAVAQPRLIRGEQNIRASGIDIVIAIDLSGSMASEDFMDEGRQVNRLEIAKKVLHKFVDERANDRIGLVAFAGRAYVASPMTLDHEFLKQNLDRLQLGMIEDRTAIGSGLTSALNRLRDLKSKSKIVILMTDGQNNAGKVPPLTAADAAHALHVKTYTIGVGTHGTAPFPAGVDPFTGQKVYQQVEVDIDEDTLQKIAEKTGGKYFRADNTQTLQKIYSEIDRLEKNEVEMKKFRQYEEIFPAVLACGLALLLSEIVLGQTIWRKLP